MIGLELFSYRVRHLIEMVLFHLSIESPDWLEIAELVERERRVEATPVEDSPSDELVGSLRCMDPVPAHVALRVAASRCRYRDPVNLLCGPAVNSRVKIVGAASVSTARLCTILKP